MQILKTFDPFKYTDRVGDSHKKGQKKELKTDFSVLSSNLSALLMVGDTRLELVTSCMSSKRSNQLS